MKLSVHRRNAHRTTIPAEVLAVTPVQDGLFAAIGAFVLQYAIPLTALVGMVALVKWTFSSQP